MLAEFFSRSMAECGVCWEIFEKEGTKCPKLLPCIHTFCFSCLKILETNGEIQCPYCRTLHQIPSEHIENLPTNHGILKNKRYKKIYTLPSSRVQPQIGDRIGICELHGRPAISITYNTIDSSQRRFCETCLNLDGTILPEQDSEREDSCYSLRQCQLSNTATINGGMDSGNYWGGEPANYAVRNESGEIILLPSSRPTTRQTNRNDTVQNMEQHLNQCQQSNRKRLMKILKRLLFILSSPIFISGCILIALVTIPIGFIIGFGYIIRNCASCMCCSSFIKDFKDFVGQFINYPYDKYACFIITLLGCVGEENDSRIVLNLCRGVAQVVVYLALVLDFAVFACLLYILLVFI